MQKIKQTLMTSIFEVFEKMFYVFLEPIEKTHWDHQAVVSIRFTGPMNGVIETYFSKGLSEVMVQNMLNLDEGEVSEKLREDCLKESVNMICGNFLRRLDSSKVFDLSLPLCETPGGQQKDDSTAGSEQKLLLDFASGNEKLGIMCTVSRTE
jgi:CheY-specific phosphatase CheX